MNIFFSRKESTLVRTQYFLSFVNFLEEEVGSILHERSILHEMLVNHYGASPQPESVGNETEDIVASSKMNINEEIVQTLSDMIKTIGYEFNMTREELEDFCVKELNEIFKKENNDIDTYNEDLMDINTEEIEGYFVLHLLLFDARIGVTSEAVAQRCSIKKGVLRNFADSGTGVLRNFADSDTGVIL